MTAIRGLAWRLIHPRRTIRPTRDGWWCLLVAVGLGVAAINTGNNLLHLLVSLLLALIVVSGVLSEQSMRGLALTGGVPEEMYAGQPAIFGATIANRKRWSTSYSITIELLTKHARTVDADSRFIYVRHLAAGTEHLVAWQETLPRRGRQRVAGVRITTRFPFGLFVKAGRAVLGAEVVVFPAVHSVSASHLRQNGGAAESATRRRGRGPDLYNLRSYRSGDDPRLIHWRSSAKTETLMVRELEAETSQDTRLVLLGPGARGAQALEAGLSEAASLAVALIRGGAGVELVGPGLFVALGQGRTHLRRVLTALALYEPGAPATQDSEPANNAPGELRPLREIRVSLA